MVDCWTLFWDMHSGGGLKHGKSKIFIQASKAEAKVIFFNRFSSNPDRVSCTCCGPDYAVDEGTFSELSKFHESCKPEWLVIPDGDIKPEERIGEVPEQGYRWVD